MTLILTISDCVLNLHHVQFAAAAVAFRLEVEPGAHDHDVHWTTAVTAAPNVGDLPC